MKKVLITGASGFVGKYLIDEFLKDGYEVVACDLTKREDSQEGVVFEEMNVLDFEQVKSVIDRHNPNYLINLAAISSVGASWKIPQTTIEVNVVGTLNILEALKENHKDCKVLLIGSSEEYEISDKPLSETNMVNANNPYGISKVAQENFAKMYIERYGMKIVCTRSFNHTGAGQRDNFVIPSFCKQAAEIEKSGQDGTIYVGNLEIYRDFSDVKDIVYVYKKLLENENEELIYNVGSGIAYKLSDLLDYIVSLSSQKIEIKVDPEKYRPVDNPYICCDNSKIKEHFKGTDLKQTIKEMYEYYLNN